MFDVNVAIAAHRCENTHHQICKNWLNSVLNSADAFYYSDIVLAAFCRIVTNGKIFREPTPRQLAFQFAELIRSHPLAICLPEGEQHWQIFTDLCLNESIKSEVFSDAYLAAIAIEHDVEFFSLDADFEQFKKLKFTKLGA